MPAGDYAEAKMRLEAWLAQDTPEVDPQSRTCLLTHGQKVERAIVLLHGYTTGPRMFRQLGEQFFQQGYNVLIPRAPQHGFRDRMTPALAKLTSRQLVDFVNEAVDIAQGLGEQVTVAGLSMGGVLSAWAAQFRSDVHLAGLISPAFGFQRLPSRLAPLISRLALLLPNFFIWWDAKLKDTPAPPFCTYPRYASRSLAHILSLGRRILSEAHRSAPKAQSVKVITNPSDASVDNAATMRLIAAWQAAGAQNVSTYAFEAQYGLIHDLISPEQPNQQVGVVYPVLLELLAGEGIGD